MLKHFFAFFILTAKRISEIKLQTTGAFALLRTSYPFNHVSGLLCSHRDIMNTVLGAKITHHRMRSIK